MFSHYKFGTHQMNCGYSWMTVDLLNTNCGDLYTIYETHNCNHRGIVRTEFCITANYIWDLRFHLWRLASTFEPLHWIFQQQLMIELCLYLFNIYYLWLMKLQVASQYISIIEKMLFYNFWWLTPTPTCLGLRATSELLVHLHSLLCGMLLYLFFNHCDNLLGTIQI